MRHDTPARVAVVSTERVYIGLVQPLQCFTRVRSHTAACGSVHTVHAKGNNMSDAKRTRSVSFRLTDEEHTQLERAAIAAGEEVNNWCRQLAITAARGGPLFGEN